MKLQKVLTGRLAEKECVDEKVCFSEFKLQNL